MKNRILIRLLVITLVFCTSFFKNEARADSFFSQGDRQVHAAASGLISSISYVTLRANRSKRWTAFITSLAIANILGALKETSDTPMNKNDLQANAIGSTIGTITMFSFDF